MDGISQFCLSTACFYATFGRLPNVGEGILVALYAVTWLNWSSR